MLHISKESQKALQNLGKSSMKDLLKLSQELRDNIHKVDAAISNTTDRLAEMRANEDKAAEWATRSSDTTNTKGRSNER